MHNATEQRDNKDIIAIAGSVIVVGLLLLFFYFWKIVTPIPAFPEPIDIIELELQGGSDFGNYTEGQGHSESIGMGDGQGDKSLSTPVAAAQVPQDNSFLGNPADDPTPIKSSPNPVESKPVNAQPKPDNELSAALNAFSNSKGNTGGGDGNANQAGNQGTPDGKGGKGSGDGPGIGPGISLKGRTIVRWPDEVKDSKEEGRVVVGIIVDAGGNVIKAEPGEPGSTTTNAMLYMKARQAALNAKFSPSPTGAEEQYGTITFVFRL